MPRIPVYQQQVQTATPEAQVPRFRKPVDIGQAANASMEAVKNYGETMNKITNMLTQRIAERQEMEAKTNIANHDSAFRVDMQNMLYDQAKGDDGNPKGYLLRQLDQTKNLTPDFDKAYTELKQKYVDSMDGDYQKSILASQMDDHYTQVRGQVLRHQTDEENKAYNLSIDTNLQMMLAQSAAITDPTILDKEIARAKELSAARDKFNGLSDEEIKATQYKIAGQFTKNAVDAIVEKNSVVAKNLLNSMKDKLLPSDVNAIQTTIDGKAFHEKAQNVWGSLQNLKLADGTPDLNRMDQAIYNMPNTTPEQKDQLRQYVSARASEAKQIMHSQDAANELAFTNQAIQMRNEGKSLDETMKLTGAFGKDNKTKLAYSNYISQLYSDKFESDKQTVVSLWEGIRRGTTTQDDIDNANKIRKINGNDWETLRKDWFNHQMNGESQADKDALALVRIKAEKKFGTSNKEKLDTFMYMYRQRSRDLQSFEDKVGAADSLLKLDDTSGWTLPLLGKFGRSENYRTNFDTQEAQRQAINLYRDIANETKDRAKLDAVNNAIQSLVKRNKPVVKENVEAILKQRPDGIW